MSDETPVIQAAPLHAPGAGGWVPPQWFPLASGFVASIAGAVSPVILMPDAGWRMYVAAALGGLVSFASTYLGLKSAGPRS